MIPINARVVFRCDILDSNPLEAVAGTVVDWKPNGLLCIEWDDGSVSWMNAKATLQLEWI